MGLAYDVGGPGDASFNDAAQIGLKKSISDLGLPQANTRELTAAINESEDAALTRLRQLVSEGYNPIIAVGFKYATGVKTVGAENPNVRFAIVDDNTVELPNVTPLVFAEEQGSFLAGAAAALKTQTCRIGFVGGVDVPLIQKFQAGYEQGPRRSRRTSRSTSSTSARRATSPASTTRPRGPRPPRVSSTAART